MAMPEEENQKNKEGVYFKGDDGLWHCEKCDFTTEAYPSILGHQGKHTDRPAQPRKGGKTVGRAGNLRAKDPMRMTIEELLQTVLDLREALRKAEVEGADAIAWKSKMETLFSSSVEKNGPPTT